MLVALLPTVQGSSAASVASSRADVATDVKRIEMLETRIDRLAAQRATIVAQQDELGDAVRDRLVAIYKLGNGTRMTSILAAGGSDVERASDAAGVVATVKRHDSRAMRRWRVLGKRLTAIDGRREAAAAQLVRTRKHLVASRRALRVAARRAAQIAAEERARAAEMATVADVPLTPRAVSPETVAAATATEHAPVEQDTTTDAGHTAAGAAGGSFSGTASMYADSFTGKPTANGERYDPNAMTAAHPSLPFGTWLMVQGPGGTALVRVNDRGPFHGGRVLDLSRAAANAVGLGGLGTVTCTVQR